MKIQNNLWAMNANRNIKINTGKTAKTTEKLSSGYRINRAADDAAGLSISEKMRRLIRGLTQASRNCHDGISMVQTAEGALNEVHDMLQRMNELAVQSANGTNAQEDRDALQQEFAQIQEEIDRVSQTTTFNAIRLFADEDGSTGTTNAGAANGTNNSNTPSVTSLDETQQEAPVMRMMSLRSVAAVAENSVTVGDFTITGDNLVAGTDYSFADGVLTILSNKAITIANKNPNAATAQGIIIDSSVTAGNITLAGVNINANTSYRAGIRVNGNATVTLASGTTNTVHSSNDHGITLGANASLTLEGEGKLDAKGSSSFCGVNVAQSGNLIINNGIIMVAGDGDASGIGGGVGENSGNITINGGSVTATGGKNGAGIGGGKGGGNGNITINGGSVTATGGALGAGIGGGVRGNGGNITINGGSVTATGGALDGAGIGNGYQGSGGDITINGGTVTAIGGKYGAGIGGGGGGTGESCGTITITDGTVIATGGAGGAGIGGGNNDTNGTITISGGNITATGGSAIGGNTPEAIGAGGESGSGVTFSTGTNGNAEMTLAVADGNTDISALITDTSKQSQWSGLINDVQYGNPIPQGNGNIDLSTLTDTFTITDTGYQIGSTEYKYTGDYTFTGTTTQDIVVSSNANIKMNGVTGGDFTVTNNATANVELAGTNTMTDIKVESGSILETSGSGTLKVSGTLDNNGIINNGAIIENDGTIDNDGTLKNDGTVNNNTNGTVENDGTVDNNGTFKNEGTVNNNTNGTIDSSGIFDNTNGTVNDKGGTVSGTITGNQPVDNSGSGGGTGGATAGTAKNSWWIQAGAEAGQGINIEIGAMNTKVLGIDKGTVNILTQESSGNAITAVSGAIEKLSEQRSRLGAYQNRLEHTIRNLDNVVENTTYAESLIRDADMAELMVEHANNNIIMQAAQAMLAQANHQPDGVLQLLQ